MIILEGIAEYFEIVVDVQVDDTLNDLHAFFLTTDHEDNFGFLWLFPDFNIINILGRSDDGGEGIKDINNIFFFFPESQNKCLANKIKNNFKTLIFGNLLNSNGFILFEFADYALHDWSNN